MTNKKVKIVIDEWNHTCGDGCCYTWGKNINLNGTDLSNQSDELGTQIQQVLEHLGYEVEIINTYNGEIY